MSYEAAKSILRTAAPGHSDAVAENIQKLGNQKFSSDQWLTEIQDELTESYCIDTNINELDHPLAKSLHEKLKQYQNDIFLSKPGVSARVAVTAVQNNSNQLLVHTYAEKIDNPNKNSGNWKASWTIDKVELGVGEISGHVVVHSYTHEDGNVQLTISKKFPRVSVRKVSFKEDEGPSLVDGIVQQIMKWETIILGILVSMNDSVTSDHLKSIRRILPITKQKMNWDANAHRSVKTLTKTTRRDN
eukprot:CAMPEP_0170862630 /NCGR_PEP_ID=MMETSP0734-20130129/19120_1 /TAXON_ID=186038 /ORGANISM="Fragilariopsis kerguelensis, Strain L26-C5" /LENGTH=244 /DNA_ID=CAMNT_0011237331 /DNA_START=50 /DNA_END=784 /DNA_ORIENTATION=+